MTNDEARDPEEMQNEDAREHRRTGNRRRMAILSLLILAVAGIGAVLLFTLRPGPERREPEAAPPLVEVVEVQPRRLRLTVRSQGTVRPLTESTLAAQVSGRVVAVSPNLREGAFFARGEALVRIDPSDYRLALQDARAALEQARARLERAEAEAAVAREELALLEAGGEASALARHEPQLAEARSGLEAARAILERAQLNLARTTIEAPYDGRVRTRQVDVGQVVAPGTPVAAVFATDAAEVELPLSKEDVGFLPPRVAFGSEVSPEVRVLIRAELGGALHSWTGRIVRTAGEIDPRTRMLSVFARIDDPYRREAGAAGPPLPMGLFVEAEIPGRELADVYAVPRPALSSEGRVRVVGADDRLQLRPVEVVRATADRVVIAAGLEPGDRVVVSRLETVTDGMRVRVADAGPAGEGAEEETRGAEEPTVEEKEAS